MPQMGGTPQSRATGPEATQRGVQQYGLDTHAPQQTTFGSNEAGFGSERQRIENELFSRMAPEHARQTEAARTRLANQGMTMGSEAYNRELERIGGLQAGERFNALQTGGAEQQRLNQMLLAQNQQAFGQDTASQQAQNAALQAQFGQGLAAGQFANQAGQQAFGQNLAANQQNFGQDLSAAQFQNQNRQQALAEEAYRRGLPLNELNALLTGQQVGAPQMPSFSQSGMASPTNYLGAAQSQGDYSMDVAKMDAAANNALMGTAGTLGAAGIAAMAMTSDRRLKRNIVPLGRGWYAFNYLWDDILRFGVMAQEVLAWKPEAVGVDALGFYTVDYARL
jgi:hypothetical protein